MSACKRAILIATLICSASPATSGSDDGNSWLGACRSQSLLERGICTMYIAGYVAGAEDALVRDALRRGLDGVTVPFCRPQGVTRDQMRLVVIRFMEKNPTLLHLNFAMIIGGAMSDAFPCKDGPVLIR